MENEERRAAILEIDPATGATRVFASGLRNPNGLDWQPQSGALWTAVNERDEIGNDLVPDYMTSVKDGGFYGWPYSYFGRHVDKRPQPARPDLVEKAIVPDYALGAHTASLGLVFYRSDLLPQRYRGGAFVGQHGSWNRQPPGRLPRDLRPVLRRAAQRQQARRDSHRLPRRRRAMRSAVRSA